MPAFRPSRLLALSLAAALSLGPRPAAAQGWSDYLSLFSPARLIQQGLQFGVMMLRTQMDIKYGDMAVHPLSGRVVLTDVQIWPLPDWDEDGSCEIRIDRLSLRGAALDRPDQIRFKVQLSGLDAPTSCLPPDARPALQAARLERLSIPRLTLDTDYDIAGAEARVHAHGVLDGLAALSLTADMPYAWIDGREDMDNPDPVVFLSRATLSAEDLGAWQALQGFVPPPMVNPSSAPVAVDQILRGIFTEMNADAMGPDAGGDPAQMTPAQEDFIASAVAAWTGFLADPSRLVLETGFAPENDVYVDFIAYEDDPRLIFDDLQPRLALAPAQARAVLPAGLLRQALGEGAAQMAPGDRLSAGIALLNGEGAPRNTRAGMALLGDLAESGNGAAALALSEALETRAPDQAYRWALIAGGAGEAGATARLDRLEGVLPFDAVLALQEAAAGDTRHPTEALARIGLIREQAAARLSGKGRTRSYGIAAMWAMLAAAAGDAEGADILAEIDERVRLAGAGAQQAWAPVEAGASDLAMEAWVGQDLPARLGTGQ